MPTTISLRALALSAAVGLAATACGGTPYRFIKQSGPPSALKGTSSTLVVFDYSRTVVGGKPVEQWVRDKTAEDPDYGKTWSDLRSRWEMAFKTAYERQGDAVQMGTAASQTDPGQLKVVVEVMTFNMGKYFVVSSTPTVMDTIMSFYVDGEMTDSISTSAARNASAFQPSVFQHVGPIMERIGTITGQFVRDQRKKN